MGTQAGCAKTAAKKLGISPEDYAARIAAGDKWCVDCRAWHPRTEFSPDYNRSDSLSVRCRAANNRLNRARRQKKKELAT